MTSKPIPFVPNSSCTAQPGALPVYLQDPGPNDVLLGRGAPFLQFEGNKRFRLIIQSRKEAYQNASRNRDKNGVARSVINEVAMNGGRFLEPVVDTFTKVQMRISTESRLWRLAADDVAMEKCRQALRNRSTKTASREAIRNQGKKPPPPSQEVSMTHNPAPPSKDPGEARINQFRTQQTASVSTLSSSETSEGSKDKVPVVTSTSNSGSDRSSNNNSYFKSSGVPANVSTQPAPNEEAAAAAIGTQIPHNVSAALEEIRKEEEQAHQLQQLGQYLADVGRQKARESQERRAALAAKILLPRQGSNAVGENAVHSQPELQALMTLANSLQGSTQTLRHGPQSQESQAQFATNFLHSQQSNNALVQNTIHSQPELQTLMTLANMLQGSMQNPQQVSGPLTQASRMQMPQKQEDSKPAAVGKRKKFPKGTGRSESSETSSATATPSSTLSWLGNSSNNHNNNNFSEITMTKSMVGDNASSLSVRSPSEYFHTSSSSDNDNPKRTEDSDGNASTIPSGSVNSNGNESNEDSTSNSENEGEERQKTTHSSSDGDVSSG